LLLRPLLHAVAAAAAAVAMLLLLLQLPTIIGNVIRNHSLMHAWSNSPIHIPPI
jgi:hypothetical protein